MKPPTLVQTARVRIAAPAQRRALLFALHLLRASRPKRTQMPTPVLRPAPGRARAFETASSVRTFPHGPYLRACPPGPYCNQPNRQFQGPLPGPLPPLFYGHRFRQIARLIDIRTHQYRRLVGDELSRHSIKQWRHKVTKPWHLDVRSDLATSFIGSASEIRII